MKYRLDTLEADEELRRAIRWGTNGHRTPASREECAAFAERAIEQAHAEVLEPYRKYMAVLQAARSDD